MRTRLILGAAGVLLGVSACNYQGLVSYTAGGGTNPLSVVKQAQSAGVVKLPKMVTPNMTLTPNVTINSSFRDRVKALWELAGYSTPFYLVKPPVPPAAVFTGQEVPPCEAHHIVAQTDARAVVARNYMHFAGMSVDDTANGVYLTRVYHQTLNTNIYQSYQAAIFWGMATSPGGNVPAIAAQKIRAYLQQSRINLNGQGGCLGIWTVG